MRDTARQYLSLHQQHKSQETNGDELPRQKIDAYQAILNSTLPEKEKEPDRVAQEVLTLLIGGSATTMRVMSRVLFHVISAPNILKALRSELDTIMPLADSHPELELLEQQRYLVSHHNSYHSARLHIQFRLACIILEIKNLCSEEC